MTEASRKYDEAKLAGDSDGMAAARGELHQLGRRRLRAAWPSGRAQ